MANKHLNEVQIQTLLQLAEGRPRDYALLALSAYTGLRIGDILKLDVGDVLDEGGRIRETIVLVQSKTKRRITIPVNPALRAALRRYLDQRLGVDRKEPLILNEDRNGDHNLRRGSGRLGRTGAHRIFKRYIAQVLGRSEKDLVGIATHTLRRSLAVMVYEKYDKDLRVAQEFLGHKSIATTGVYLNKTLAEKQAIQFREGLDFAPRPKGKSKK